MGNIQIPGTVWPMLYALASGLLVANFGSELWVYAVLAAVASALKVYDIVVTAPEQPQSRSLGTPAPARRSKVQRFLFG